MVKIRKVDRMNKTVSVFLLIVLLFIGCAKKSSLSSQFLKDRKNFVDSVNVLNEARDLTQPPQNNKGDTFDIPEKKEKQIFSLSERGISLSKNISDVFLDYLHPDLKTMYRDKLIKGTELWYEGAKNSYSLQGVNKQNQGNKLIVEWIDWFEKHKKEIGKIVFEE